MGGFEDKVGKFYVVLYPRPEAEFDAIFFETTAVGFVMMFENGLCVGDIYGIYSQKAEAVDVADALLAAGGGRFTEDA